MYPKCLFNVYDNHVKWEFLFSFCRQGNYSDKDVNCLIEVIHPRKDEVSLKPRDDLKTSAFSITAAALQFLYANV